MSHGKKKVDIHWARLYFSFIVASYDCDRDRDRDRNRDAMFVLLFIYLKHVLSNISMAFTSLCDTVLYQSYIYDHS